MVDNPIDDGAVVVEKERIVEVGAFAEVKKRFVAEVLDLGEHVLLPGLINAHCHLDYTVLRGKIRPPSSFAKWIEAINSEKAKLTQHDYIDSMRAGFAEAARFGTTTIANLTAHPKLACAIEEPIRTWWFGELIDVRNPEQAETIADEAADELKSKTNWGLAPHAPFTASSQLYARCEEIARTKNIRLTTHLAESREEMQMFRDATGPAFDFLKSIGRPIDDCGHETPFSLFRRTRSLDERWIIAHLNELGATDLDLLADTAHFHVAHNPRSHRYFGHSPFAFEQLRERGFNICLGTDSLASNSDLSLFAEMRAFLIDHSSVSPREAVAMATMNGAAALGRRDRLGCIRTDALADLVALPISNGNIFENIVAFSGDVPWMMLNGVVTVSP